MEKLLAFDCPPVTSAEKDRLDQIIRIRRVQTVERSLEALRTPQAQSRLGSYAGSVALFLKELGGLAQRDQKGLDALMQHWSVAFLLSRLLFDRDLRDEPQQFAQLSANLTGVMLFERVLNGAPLPAAQYRLRTDANGRLHSMVHGRSLEIHDAAREQCTEWSFSGDSVEVRAESGLSFRLSLPLSDNPFVISLPLTTLISGDFPVLDESVVLGAELSHGGNVKNSKSVNWSPMPMAESLDGAQKLIKKVMPQTLEWAGVFVPAFVDVGASETRDSRTSGSYEPGTPVFLCQVPEAVCHAEDIVHELQHHRLLLFASSAHFKSWDNPVRGYISPYRPDPRPLRGLYLGVHALLAVNEMKKRLIQRGEGPQSLVPELIQTHYHNLFSLRTILEHEQFSEFGEYLTIQMAALVCEHHDFVSSLTRQDLQTLAQERMAAHVCQLQRESNNLVNDSALYREWDQTVRLAEAYSRRKPVLPS